MTAFVSLELVTQLPRFVTALGSPEAVCAIIGRSEGSLVPERDFMRFPIPHDLIEWFAREALHPHISIELQVFEGTTLPFTRLVSHSVTCFVEATTQPETQWFRSGRGPGTQIFPGMLANRSPGAVCSIRREGNGPGVLHAITAYAPPVHWYDRQLDRKDGFG